MRIQLKGDAICTLLLVLAFCTLLYFQFGRTSPRGNQEEKHRKPSTKSKNLPNTVDFRKHPQMRLKITQARPRHISGIKQAELVSKELHRSAIVSAVTYSSFDFQQYLRNKDERNFSLLINQPNKCKKTQRDPFLLIAIKSTVEDFDRRETVRKTWGREGSINGLHIQRVFLLGVPINKTAIVMWETLVQHESQIYKDVLLWDFLDTFFNLTLKEIHFLNWAAEFCSNVNFIFKGDIDVFVNIENIVDFLQAHSPIEDLFVGDIIDHAKPIRIRKSKYFIPETMYGLGMYPSYAGGGGFLMSGSTMKKLAQACEEVELFPIDDVFLGMCLQRINLKPISHNGFKTFGIVKPSAAPHLQTFDPCFYKDLMVVHSLKVSEIWLMWNLLHSPNLSCTKQQSARKPFRWKKVT
ncbi:UDP-GlcNAc:betaGal beta-1,3-N-acetylglucosaminyltransferase 9 [Rhinatrema bivittatum]|uniref:UDP-GlcNAc:betaGal beta-1,3-N-acetylglucosaminyltransferase 9 n=1 Tax=Rhinatrema bivittatum TaxID=194408 RepID=UPI00112E7384|nr:UDP-GlcNAc:betaGal beta-1,3-N-acetylglucosaminyltransferase 9 [Rhinatrema bivittatum]XP_029464543.1 UDP-GlcNAc:betaGal beta-1,3-N-acetylglucosaminyltransferase 9 [Rhinatrema bivittatum]XP_029464544.1 UDP-GlcNAc:betaGal beta-1,3-N-acetylglucosaminyltransferase 9 [Rhinatrema bivittatum]XP_029464545.1 UDP-GlcNAc:betaGal beta-1,3-N-acetylglucosaminyltransferase 9 [Rhinatrema bivittatum]